MTPPRPPMQPPMPFTLPSALFGNTSDVVVNKFAENPWCADVARLNKQIAKVTLGTITPVTAIGIAAAQMNIAVFRALLLVQPRFIRNPESQPPPMLPKHATK